MAAKTSSFDRYLNIAAGISIAVIISGLVILAVKYIIPVYNGGISFIHDFSFYKSAAESYLDNPASLYKDSRSELNYLYPPPAVFLFLPFAGMELPAAYILFQLISFVFLIIAVYLFIKAFEKISDTDFNNRIKLLIYIIAVGNAPVYMNFQSSQVGSILIFFIALFIYFLAKKKYLNAGLSLAAGVLLKLYPLVLIFAGLNKEGRKNFSIGLISFSIITLLFSLLFIPVNVYYEYAAEILPTLSSTVELNNYNQSLTAVILRFSGLYEGGWNRIDVPLVISLINNILFLIVIYFTGIRILRSGNERFIYLIMLMAVIPVFSTFGWGHLYILAIPLLLYTLFIRRTKAAFWVFIIFAIDIPESLFTKINIMFLSNLFHARFLIGVAIIIYLTYSDLIRKSIKLNFVPSA